MVDCLRLEITKELRAEKAGSETKAAAETTIVLYLKYFSGIHAAYDDSKPDRWLCLIWWEENSMELYARLNFTFGLGKFLEKGF